MSDIVAVNVGGFLFYTTRTTLSKGTHFFSTAMAHLAPDATDLFVDRDPTHFRYVLNWLRGSHVLPSDDQTLRELVCEADFYCMRDMVDSIHKARRVFLYDQRPHKR